MSDMHAVRAVYSARHTDSETGLRHTPRAPTEHLHMERQQDACCRQHKADTTFRNCVVYWKINLHNVASVKAPGMLATDGGINWKRIRILSLNASFAARGITPRRAVVKSLGKTG